MNQIKESGLKHLNDLIKNKNVYVLDASAILNKPEFDEYKLKDPSLIIITTTFLREIDNLKNKNPKIKDNYKTVTNKLRKFNKIDKLSKGVKLSKNKWLYFFPYDLINLPDNIAWLSDNYGDKHIINFSLFLKSKYNNDIYLVSADNLISIIANEKEINHLYIEPKRIRTTTKPAEIIRGDKNTSIKIQSKKRS